MFRQRALYIYAVTHAYSCNFQPTSLIELAAGVVYAAVQDDSLIPLGSLRYIYYTASVTQSLRFFSTPSDLRWPQIDSFRIYIRKEMMRVCVEGLKDA